MTPLKLQVEAIELLMSDVAHNAPTAAYEALMDARATLQLMQRYEGPVRDTIKAELHKERQALTEHPAVAAVLDVFPDAHVGVPR